MGGGKPALIPSWLLLFMMLYCTISLGFSQKPHGLGCCMNRAVNWIIVLLAMVTFGLSGCQDEDRTSSKLTAGVVKVAIKEGETTQSDILKLFGAPNLVTRSTMGDEVWNYNRISSDQSASAFGFLFGSKAVASSSSRSIDLLITFNPNDTVKTYKLIQASY